MCHMPEWLLSLASRLSYLPLLNFKGGKLVGALRDILITLVGMLQA